jgi:hypothetical protein
MRYIYFMNNLIFSPHTDDAIFSLGDYILNNNNFTIASAFAGIPKDIIGNKKHTILRSEHKNACEFVNANVINGDLLDDVYGKQDKDLLINWINDTIFDYSNVFIPLGIHHPDHIFLSDVLLEILNKNKHNIFIYAELPYRVLYPELYNDRLNNLYKTYNLVNIPIAFNNKKINAIKLYNSQIQSDIVNNLIVSEQLWEIVND